MTKVLIIDDDRDLCEVVLDWLAHDGYSADAVYDGISGREKLMNRLHDIYIIDWDMPHVSGVCLCQEYRKCGGQAPILILTGKVDVESKEFGLDSGADDYLTKPFDVKELSARLRALLRRNTKLIGDNTLRFGDISIDTTSGRVTRGGEQIDLQKTEYALLEVMLRHQTTVLSSEELILRLWPGSSQTGDGALRMTIKRLRDKIDVDGKPSIIESIKRVGYRLRSQK